MGYNIERARRTVQRTLKRFGGKAAMNGMLLEIETGRTIPVIMARREYTPREQGRALNSQAQIIISAVSIDEADFPHHERHEIVYAGVQYRIIEPVSGPRPDGNRPTHFECAVVRIGKTAYLGGVTPTIMDLGLEQYGFYKPLRILNRDGNGVPQPIAMDYGHDIVAAAYKTQYLNAASFEMGHELDIDEVEHYILQELAPTAFLFSAQLSSPVLDLYKPIPVGGPLEFGFEQGGDIIRAEYIPPLDMEYGFDLGGDMMRTQYIASLNMDYGHNLDGPVSAEITKYVQANMDIGFDQANAISRTTFISTNMDLGYDKTAIVTNTPTVSDGGDATATLGGTARHGSNLTCTFNDNDPDGLATGVQYMWQQSLNGTSGWADSVYTSNTLTVPSWSVGSYWRCRVRYTDAEGFAEEIYTAASSVVLAANASTYARSVLVDAAYTALAGPHSLGTNISVDANSWILIPVATRNTTGGNGGFQSITNNKGLTFTRLGRIQRWFGGTNPAANYAVDCWAAYTAAALTGLNLTGVTDANTYNLVKAQVIRFGGIQRQSNVNGGYAFTGFADSGSLTNCQAAKASMGTEANNDHTDLYLYCGIAPVGSESADITGFTNSATGGAVSLFNANPSGGQMNFGGVGGNMKGNAPSNVGANAQTQGGVIMCIPLIGAPL